MSDYGNACATARTEIMSALAQSLASGHIDRAQPDYLTEVFVATLHSMPPWALRAIADRKNAPATSIVKPLGKPSSGGGGK